MTGIQFITDEAGQKTAVVIDLKKHKGLWEDFEDVLVSRSFKKHFLLAHRRESSSSSSQ
jgi:hypothetical protein